LRGTFATTCCAARMSLPNRTEPEAVTLQKTYARLRFFRFEAKAFESFGRRPEFRKFFNAIGCSLDPPEQP
jgi:hypothetical protein